jgi:hypothetical protein
MRVTGQEMEQTMKRTILASIALGLVASMPLGCGAAPDEGSVDPAELGEDTAAVCTDPVWASVTFNAAAAVAGQTTSVDASYGSAQCPGGFLVDLTNTINKNISSWADWGDVPSVAGNCGFHRVTARLDGFMPPSSAYPKGHWISLSPDQTTIGSWGNGECRNRVYLPVQQGLTPYSKLRITARASTNSTGDIHIQYPNKVSVGFRVTGNGGY